MKALLKVQKKAVLNLTVSCIFLFGIISAGSLRAEVRTWTRLDGNSVAAELVQATEAAVTLELADGTRFDVNPGRLSEADRSYIDQWHARAKSQGHFMTLWATTDSEPDSGSRALALALEFNGDDKAIVPLELRSFKKGTTNVYRDIEIPIAPREVEKIRLIVVRGNDKWKVATIDFQFKSGGMRSGKISFRANRWLSGDRSEGEQHRTFVLDDELKMKPLKSKLVGSSDGKPLGIDEGMIYFNDFDDDETKDLSGSGNDGSSRGVTSAPGRRGEDDLAVKFRGDRSTFDIPIDINAAVYPQLTICVWTRPDDPITQSKIVSHDNGGYDRTLGIDPRPSESRTVNQWMAFTGPQTGIIGSVPPEADEWTFLAVVYDQDKATVRLHVNGDVFNGRGRTEEGNSSVYIGYNKTYKVPFSGLLDDLRIYPRALSIEEIDAVRER